MQVLLKLSTFMNIAIVTLRVLPGKKGKIYLRYKVSNFNYAGNAGCFN